MQKVNPKKKPPPITREDMWYLGLYNLLVETSKGHGLRISEVVTYCNLHGIHDSDEIDMILQIVLGIDNHIQEKHNNKNKQEQKKLEKDMKKAKGGRK